MLLKKKKKKKTISEKKKHFLFTIIHFKKYFNSVQSNKMSHIYMSKSIDTQ